MSHEFVLYEKRDRIAFITLNRPEVVMNAMHLPMHRELIEIFDDFKHDDDVWVAVVSGAGERAFSAGNDLKESAARNAAGGSLERPPFAAITSQYECWKPIIAAVRGYTLAGGFEMALACDLIIAADDATFSLPEVKRGMVAGAGGIHRLARQIPLKQAMALMLTGRRIDAAEAYRLGIVNEVVPADGLLDAAARWAREIAANAPVAVRLNKEAVMRSLHLTVEEAMARDKEDIKPRLVATEDFKEGPRAFAEKREPVWAGR